MSSAPPIPPGSRVRIEILERVGEELRRHWSSYLDDVRTLKLKVKAECW